VARESKGGKMEEEKEGKIKGLKFKGNIRLHTSEVRSVMYDVR